MSVAEIANIYSSINNIQLGLNEVTGNTFSNYNQLSRIVSQQANIYNTIYYGTGNLTTGNLTVTSNYNISGNLNVDSDTFWVDATNHRIGILNTNPLQALDIKGSANISANTFVRNNVGIGSTSASANLHVVGNAIISGNLNVDSGTFWVDDINNRVGILNTNPQFALDVNGTANITSANFNSSVIFGNTSGTTGVIRLTQESNINYLQIGLNTTTGSAADLFIGNYLQITSASSRKIMFKADGNVGFGTASPAYPLDVTGVANISGSLLCNNRLQGYATTSPVNNFWLGLQGSGTEGQRNAIGIAGNSPTTGLVTTIQLRTNDTNRLNIISTGNVGIGTETPNVQLQLSTDGARKLTTTTWATGSDARIKEDIVSANLDTCYQIVSNIALHHYKWIPDIANIVEDKSMLGWIAQEVETVFPKAVSKSNDYGYDDFRVLNADQMYKVMYGALQKVIQKCENYEIEINQLKDKITLLENNH